MEYLYCLVFASGTPSVWTLQSSPGGRSSYPPDKSRLGEGEKLSDLAMCQGHIARAAILLRQGISADIQMGFTPRLHRSLYYQNMPAHILWRSYLIQVLRPTMTLWPDSAVPFHLCLRNQTSVPCLAAWNQVLTSPHQNFLTYISVDCMQITYIKHFWRFPSQHVSRIGIKCIIM